MAVPSSTPGGGSLVGLPPVARADARVLILGSMPGVRSLELEQYYAGPGNRFWRLAGECLGIDHTARYAARIERLVGSGVALWDVLAHCRRRGSLDSAIVRGSEVPNDFAGFLTAHARIGLIGLNGKAAAKAFQSFVRRSLSRRDAIEVVELPSTSGANATWTYPRLRAEWSPILSRARLA